VSVPASETTLGMASARASAMLWVKGSVPVLATASEKALEKVSVAPVWGTAWGTVSGRRWVPVSGSSRCRTHKIRSRKDPT
jgi:hypothetical protein